MIEINASLCASSIRGAASGLKISLRTVWSHLLIELKVLGV